MLKVKFFDSLQDKKKFIENFDFARSSYIVSDLRSKFELQNSVLDKYSAIEDDSILRASELWKKALLRTQPNIKLVSKELMLSIIQKYLSNSDEDWLQKPGAALSVYKYLGQLMPLVSHPNARDIVKEWFFQNTESFERWGKWFLICDEIWHFCLHEKLIHSSWASGVLFNQPDLSDIWDREIFVDLGVDLQSVEAEVFKKLAETCDVQIICPKPSWVFEYGSNLRAYSAFANYENKQNEFFETLTGENKKHSIQREEISNQKIVVKRMATMLSEVKDVCSEIRRKLDSGMTLKDIAVVAPDIGVYWSVLASYLEEEGVPYNRAKTANLQSYPDICEWLARIRIAGKNWESGDLEIDIFRSDNLQLDALPSDTLVPSTESPLLSVDTFRYFYEKVYGHEDIRRSSLIWERYKESFFKSDKYSRDEFLQQCLLLWNDRYPTERLEFVYKKMLQECPQDLELSLEQWLSYLFQFVAKQELNLKEANLDGVLCIDLASMENLQAKCIFALGLSDDGLRRTESSGILLRDKLSLAATTGFHINKEDNNLEFILRWALDDLEKEFYLYYPESDFSGSSLAPSVLWLLLAKKAEGAVESIKIPLPNRWDLLQQSELSNIAEIRSWSQESLQNLQQQLYEDLGKLSPKNWEGIKIDRMSATRLEDYAQCPFIFAAKSLFRLQDLPSLDMDVDRMTNGKMVHAIFAKVFEQDRWAQLNEESIGQIIEQCRVDEKVCLGDDRRWSSLKKKYTILTKKFIAFETAYFSEFPNVKNIANEFKISTKLDSSSGQFKDDGDLKFTAFVDRVDQDTNGNYIVIDYKSSKSEKVVHFNSWLEKDLFQLGLYVMAIESGFQPGEAGDVAAANFYVVKDFQRDIGFIVPEKSQNFYEPNSRKRNLLKLEDKVAFFNSIQEKVLFHLTNMNRGKFNANPKDTKNCTKCQWRGLCRAPHLS